MRHQIASFKSPRGFALVLVLSFVALTMVLVLAMLTQATTDQTVIHSQGEEHRAERLAESTISLALAQLRTATEDSFTPETPKPWTSQPGAIRVHAMNGDLESLYKLYSSPNMKITSTQQLVEDVPPADWETRGHEFADLNAPVMREGDLHFPILDPRDATDDLGAPVEGFDYKTEGAPAGTIGGLENINTRRLPMPVRWMYMLKDGSLGTLGPSGEFIGVNMAVTTSAANPIVARIAFWMDDESCKINVNTAAEGAFWDTPRADTQQERLLAAKQPTRIEYQRQPGHPAGVCLSSVLLPGQRFHPDGFNSQMPAMSQENARDLWKLGRLQIADKDTGTSKGGTIIPEALISTTDTLPEPRPRQSRYADFDGLFFDDYKEQPGPGKEGAEGQKKTRKKQPFFETHPLAVKRLRRSSGFLTAQSASPEVTLFGTPRIALWPVHANTPSPGDNRGDSEPVVRYTRYDQTAVLAATLGEERYLIQRSDPGNGAMDLEINAVGKDGRGQNQRLLDYLRQLTDRPFPGYQKGASATFAAKYGTSPETGDRDAILLSMLDYVRSTNFADGHLAADTQFSVLCPGEAYYGFGQVAPMQPRFKGASNESGKADPIKGLGRMMTVSEVAMIITCRAEVDAEGKRQGLATSTNRSKLVKPGDRELEVGFLVEGFLPEQGWADYRPFASVGLVGGAPGEAPKANDPWPLLYLNGVLLEPVSSTTSLQAEANPPVGWRGWGGSTGVRGLTKGVIMFKPIAVPAEGGEVPKLRFSGGSADSMQLKLAVYDTPTGAGAMASSTSDLIQVIPLKLPDIIPDTSYSISLPRLPFNTELAFPLANRVNDAAKKGKMLVDEQDILQSLIPVHGDYRLIASRRWVESRTGNGPMPLFGAHPQWGKQRQAHALRDFTCFPSANAAAGLTTAAAAEGEDPGFFYYQLQVPASVQPDFPQAQGLFMKTWLNNGWKELTPQSISDQLRLDGMTRGQAWPDYTGDFDNGSGNSPDGPYTNRPDDGNWAALPQQELPYFSPDKSTQMHETVPPVSLAGFSAQRMIPSPVMFGSLPTGTRSQVPWQTLLFRPAPPLGHYGAQDPPDHLLLDLFWSPVLEPEPVSQPFETAGKINLNHQLVPFSYIHRATALHAAMKAETLMAIPDSAAASYKTGQIPNNRFRQYIDAAGTIQLWKEQVFDQGRVFLTPGEICQHPLVPEGTDANLGAINNFWALHRITGDNSKERPYAHLYSRLTTKSNTFRLHYVVETLKKARSGSPTLFNPDKDQITARKQGSCLLRRHLDFQSENLPDYLVDSKPASLNKFYHWEITGYRRQP